MSTGSLKVAGMFREFGPVGLGVAQESIFLNVDEEALPDVADVLRYLRAGHVLIDMMDIANDPFDPSRQVMNGSSILTDGDWLWREDLAYYVQRHHVHLPDDFLTLMRDRRYAVPELAETVLRDCSIVAEGLMF